MKIIHLCLGEHYVDGYGYQENIITKMQKQLGYDVYILASTETYINQKRAYIEPKEYINEHEIRVKRIPYVSWIPHKLVIKLRLYEGIYDYLTEVEPDIIFIHSACFLGIKDVVKYVRKHNIKVYVDSHTDYVNSGRTWLSMHLLHKIIYRRAHQSILPYTRKFYGTLPIRNEFLYKVYKIPADKIDYLPMGIDVTGIDISKKSIIKNQVRLEYGLNDSDFVVVSGGKLEKRKKTIELLKSIDIIKKENVKLLLFGSISEEIKEEFDIYMKKYCDRIIYVGWKNWNEIYRYIFAADLVIFPGTHSSLWEQTVGLGAPCVFKHMENITQIDLGGNCMFLEKSTPEEIAEIIKFFYSHPVELGRMAQIAAIKGPQKFSYEEIAKKAIEVSM